MPYQIAAAQIGDDKSGDLIATLVLVLSQEDMPRQKQIIKSIKTTSTYLLGPDDLQYKSFDISDGTLNIKQNAPDAEENNTPPTEITVPAIYIRFKYSQVEETFPRIVRLLYVNRAGLEETQVHMLLKQMLVATEEHFMERLIKILPGLSLKVDDTSSSEFANVVHFIYKIRDFDIRAAILNKLARIFVADQKINCAIALLYIQAYGENLTLFSQMVSNDPLVVAPKITQESDRAKYLRKIIKERKTITFPAWNFSINKDKYFLIIDISDAMFMNGLHAGLVEQSNFVIDDTTYSFTAEIGRSLDKPEEEKEVLNITFSAEQAQLVLELIFISLYGNGLYINDDIRTLFRQQLGVNSLKIFKNNAENLVQLLRQKGADTSLYFIALQNLMFDANIDWRADLVLFTAGKLIDAKFDLYAKILTAPYCNEALNSELSVLANKLQKQQYALPSKPILFRANTKQDTTPDLAVSVELPEPTGATTPHKISHTRTYSKVFG